MCANAGFGTNFDDRSFIGPKYYARRDCHVIREDYLSPAKKPDIVRDRNIFSHLKTPLFIGGTKDAAPRFQESGTDHCDRSNYSIPVHKRRCLPVRIRD